MATTDSEADCQQSDRRRESGKGLAARDRYGAIAWRCSIDRPCIPSTPHMVRIKHTI